MSEKTKNGYLFTSIILIGFIIYTMCVMHVDIKPLGLEGTDIGFAAINIPIRDFLGYNKVFYILSKVIGALSFVIVFLLGIMILAEIIVRKGIFKADQSLYALAGVYVLLGLTYILFEKVVINYRPVDLGDGLEPSYPSSHTMLGVVIFVTAAIQIKSRVKECRVRNIVISCFYLLNMLMIIFRLLSGAHWFTDVLGGVMAGTFFISLYLNLLSMIADMKIKKYSKNHNSNM